MLPHRLCRPSRGYVFAVEPRPTADAVGYFLPPLRGSDEPRTARLTPMGLAPWATILRPERGYRDLLHEPLRSRPLGEVKLRLSR